MGVVRRLINQVVFETDEKSIKDADQKVVNFKAGMKKAAMATGAALLAIGTLAVKGAADMEMMTTQFEVMLGSAEKANALMDDLKKFSASTPFSLSDLAGGTQKLLAFGVASEDAIETMRMLGDSAGGNAQKLDTLVSAYGKVQAKGKGTLEELNMITESGVPILETLAKQLNMTKEEFLNMKGGVKVSADAIKQAFKTMTSDGGVFFEGMKKQSMTFSGMLSTMKDNITLVLAEIGSKLLPTLKLIMDAITQLFQGSLGTIISDLLTTLTPLLKTVFDVVTMLIDKLVPIIASLSKLLKPIISLVNALLQIIMVVVNVILDAIGDIIGDIVSNLAPLIEELAGLLVDLLPLLTPILIIITKILLLFVRLSLVAGTTIFKILVNGLTLVLKLLRPIIRLLSIFLIPLFEFLEKIVTRISDFITGFIDKIVNGIIDIMTFIFSIINNVIEAINQIPFVKDKLEPLNSEEIIKQIKGEQQQINKQANINQQNQFNFNGGGGQDTSAIVDGVKRAIGTPFQVKLKELVIDSL